MYADDRFIAFFTREGFEFNINNEKKRKIKNDRKI